jgi:hypothetical protein
MGTKILKKGLTVTTMSEDSFVHEGKWRLINMCTYMISSYDIVRVPS